MAAGNFLRELKRRHVVRVAVAYAVTGWLLTQLAAIVLPTYGAPTWVLKVVIALLVLFFPVALLLAWAFEITPEGVRRTASAGSEEARSPAMRRRIGRTLDFAIIAVLAAAVGVLLWRQFGTGHRPAAVRVAATATAQSPAATTVPAESIAVLPFVNDSGDKDQQYFSDGLTEDLIIAFSQYPGLKVIGRESSFQLRNTQLDSKTIGEKLGVAHLLEGSVSKAGDEVRIRAELVNAADGSTLWSQHYDRPYQDLFALQDDITQQVATALKAKLLGGGTAVVQTDRPPSGNLQAYNAYLQGNYYLNQFSGSSFKQAIAAYQQAIKLDPDYAAAYAQVSFAWSYLARYIYSRPADVQRADDEARAAADTALRLAPELAVAHLAKGYSMWARLEWVESEPEFRKAYRLAPGSSDARRLFAASLQNLGHLNESIGLLRQAIAADPLDSRPYYDLSLGLIGTGETEAAETAIRKAISLAPTAAAYHAVLAWYEAGNGQADAALQAAQAEPSPRFRAWAMALAYVAEGDKEKADAALQELVAGYADVVPYFIADAYAFRRQPDEALAWLDRACKQRDPLLEVLVKDRYLLRYRNDPRFASECRKAGIAVPVLAPGASSAAAPAASTALN